MLFTRFWRFRLSAGMSCEAETNTIHSILAFWKACWDVLWSRKWCCIVKLKMMLFTQHAERINTLKQNLEKSTRKCNLKICGCPIHRSKCPLSPVCFNEKRWPGSDGFISSEDRHFLDSLRPAPQWWNRAWGRTNHWVFTSSKIPLFCSMKLHAASLWKIAF